jgi:hypothetical protein
VDAKEVVKSAPGPEAFGKASSVVLFAQKIVRFFGPDLAAGEIDRHEIVMILNKKGGEAYGRVDLGGRVVEARVFHADGRVLEPDPVQEGRAVALPALDRGQILEIRTVEEFDVPPPRVGLRQLFRDEGIRRPDEPVLRYRLVLEVPEGAPVRLRTRALEAPPAAREGGHAVWAWDLRDLPEWDEEPFMPGSPDSLPSVALLQGRPDQASLERSLRGGSMETAFPAALKGKAEEICRGKTEPLDRLRALFDFCATEIRDGWGPPLMTLRRGEGSIADLFPALARAAGFEVWTCHTRGVPPLGTEWDLDPLEFTGRALYVPLGAGGVYLQPGRFHPFGALPPEAYGAEALLVSRSGCRWARIPEPPLEEVAPCIRGEVRVDADGKAEVEGTFAAPGLAGAEIRSAFEQGMSESMRKAAVSQLANSLFPRIQVRSWEIDPFDPGKRVSALSFRGPIRGFARAEGGTLRFPAVRCPTQAGEQFVHKTTRAFPAVLDFGPAGLPATERVSYVFPEGSEVRAPPGRIAGGVFGRALLRFEARGNRLTVIRETLFYRQAVPPERWEAFREFCREVDDLERTTVVVVLPRAGGPGGGK